MATNVSNIFAPISNKKADGPYEIPDLLIYKYIGIPKDIAVFSGSQVHASITSIRPGGYRTGKYNSDDFKR
jgi:hypothetical protein